MTEVARYAQAYRQVIDRWVASVYRLSQHTRRVFYEIALSRHACPACGHAHLLMLQEGRFACRSCGHAQDPTLMFQRCPDCGGRPALARCRYRCRRCGHDITSRFLFDGRVYDPAYFRERMAASRARKRHRRIEHQAQQASHSASRSPPCRQPRLDLDSSPGLADALDDLVRAGLPDALLWAGEDFDLRAYERHVLRLVDPGDFRDVTRLEPLHPPATRRERVRLFIACLFLDHAGAVELEERSGITWVNRHESD